MNELNLSDKLEKVANIGTWKVFLDKEELWWSPVTYAIHEEDPHKKVSLQDGINYYVKEHQPIITKYVTEGMKQGKAWDVELQIKTVTGKIKWVRAIGEPVLQDGKFVMLQGLFHDIDERKRNSLALQRAHQKINLALSKSGVGFWEWDVKNNVLSWDDSMYSLFGVDKKDFSSAYDAWLSRLLPEDRLRGDKEVQEALDGKKDFDTDFRIKWPDGSIHYIKAYAEIIRDEKGEPLTMLGTNWDITREKRYERKIKYQNYQLQNVFDAIPGLVIHKSKDDVMVRVNKYAAESMDTTTENMNGRPSTDFYDKELCKKYHKDDLEVIESDEPKLGIIEEVHGADGERFWIRTDKVPYKNEEGVNTGVVLCAFDITKQMESQKKLERLNEELTQFTYRTSHDLKAPLMSVSGLINIMQVQLQRQEYRGLENNLKTSAQVIKKLDKLILDLLNLTKAEHIDDFNDQIKLNDVVEEICEVFLLQDPAIKIDLEIDKDFTFKSSSIRMKQILENLISNAFKYKDPDKKDQKISISAQSKKDQVLIEVKDNGLGIPSEYQEQLFKMFKRFHNEIEGSGLGLYLVKKHIEALKGTILFEGSDSETVFKISLPAM